MSRRLLVLMIGGLLSTSGMATGMPAADASAAAPGPPTGNKPASGPPPGILAEIPPTLTINEETDPSGGRRVRVSTPIVRINDFQGSLTLRLECLHPVGSRVPPDQCMVNVIHRDIQAKYSLQRTTRFQVGVNKTQVFDGKLTCYAARKEGPEVVEPLVGFWDYKLIKKLAGLQYDKVEFLLEKDKIGVDQSCLAVLQDMVKYFG